ncbi:MAG: thiamine phosphate synthase [Chloroflexi bacterium]|nr:thiamine phosphate synthase [Chloroflexota bacterium]
MWSASVLRLHLVTDRKICGRNRLAEVVAQAVAGGVDAVHLREPDLGAGELYRVAIELKAAIGGRALLVVNDRVDVALAVGADGVQLGGRSLSVEATRLIAGGRLLVGRSVHSVEEAAVATAAGADYLVAGSVFATASHPDQPPAGVELIRAIHRTVSVPVYGIGGIDRANAAAVVAAGAQGVAVIRAILAATDPLAAAQELATVVAAAARPSTLRGVQV